MEISQEILFSQENNFPEQGSHPSWGYFYIRVD